MIPVEADYEDYIPLEDEKCKVDPQNYEQAISQEK